MAPFQAHQRFPSLSVRIETVHETVEIVCARGEVDLLTGPELERCIDIALDRQPSAIIIDLTDVDFLAAFGMSILLRTDERRSRTTQLVVVADGPATSRPLTILGLTDVLTIRPTLQAALDALHLGAGDAHA
jgi:anti-sigma B factor antagonist